MNINEFVNQDIAAFLDGFRPLQGWEQLHIIFHSTRPLRKKREAYECLLSEFEDDNELTGHLHRHIHLVDNALYAMERVTPQGHIFIAGSRIDLVDEEIRTVDKYDNSECVFSTYSKAKRWLDEDRCNAIEDGDPIRCSQWIDEIELDSNNQVYGWRFDNDDEVYSFDDAPICDRYDRTFPEYRYVHLPGLYRSGEILLLREDNGGMGMDSYAITPHGHGNLSQDAIDHSDDSDEAVFVMRYNSENGTVGHDHWPMWRTEKLRHALPDPQQILQGISNHFSGVQKLAPDDIKRLDPIGFFYWEDSK